MKLSEIFRQSRLAFSGPPDRPDSSAPWLIPPPGHLPFVEVGNIQIPTIGNSATVLRIEVPVGYDGVIRRLANNYLGGGFVSGSGDIVWQLLADGRPIRNFESITSELGNSSTPLTVDAIRIYSGQVIEYVVTHVANAALGDLVQCQLSGYYYPVQ